MSVFRIKTLTQACRLINFGYVDSLDRRCYFENDDEIESLPRLLATHTFLAELTFYCTSSAAVATLANALPSASRTLTWIDFSPTPNCNTMPAEPLARIIASNRLCRVSFHVPVDVSSWQFNVHSLRRLDFSYAKLDDDALVLVLRWMSSSRGSSIVALNIEANSLRQCGEQIASVLKANRLQTLMLSGESRATTQQHFLFDNVQFYLGNLFNDESQAQIVDGVRETRELRMFTMNGVTDSSFDSLLPALQNHTRLECLRIVSLSKRCFHANMLG
jgi:hypothetical protein